MSRPNLSHAIIATLKPERLRILSLPVYLCPTLLSSRSFIQKKLDKRDDAFRHISQLSGARRLQSHIAPPLKEIHQDSRPGLEILPQQCPGCGAFSQTLNDEIPGFYSLGRKRVKLSGGFEHLVSKKRSEDQIVKQSLRNMDAQLLETLVSPVGSSRTIQTNRIPVCDRCHNLFHHNTGISISHPSMESMQNIISESPHKYNHIYHIIDAADFPMSLIPQLHRLLHLTPQRSRNRRAKTSKFYHSRKNEASFIITRSDLLAPLKSQVDSLMPYLTNVLRDALGSAGRHIRLGNVRCVSAKRGWWTGELKEEIWARGGGGWMVGKVNVGKSQLFERVFPKGRRGMPATGEPPLTLDSGPTKELSFSVDGQNPGISWPQNVPDYPKLLEGNEGPTAPDRSFSLLPPLQPEVDYPAMPLVSSLPGTTASPIRIPFGNGKGELVDLPGLSRSDLEHFVQERHQSTLIMRSRVTPVQEVIKPGQSLLLGGFIRITPKTPGLVFLGYSFTPLSSHLTSTDKAIGIQSQESLLGVESIANPGVGDTIKSAGNFPLKWDVTKLHSGPTIRGSGIVVENLPYRVFSTDILIEGCGWVELTVQVRKRALEPASVADSDNSMLWPTVEVFSPEGRFIAARRPLGAWLLNTPRKIPGATRKRPRRSMRGMKRKSKLHGRGPG